MTSTSVPCSPQMPCLPGTPRATGGSSDPAPGLRAVFLAPESHRPHPRFPVWPASPTRAVTGSVPLPPSGVEVPPPRPAGCHFLPVVTVFYLPLFYLSRLLLPDTSRWVCRGILDTGDAHRAAVAPEHRGHRGPWAEPQLQARPPLHEGPRTQVGCAS